ERRGRNPKTQEEIVVPAAKVPVFRPFKTLKEAIDK
ncbi:MAG: HU family DNA-binding protein, partial [Thermaerobacter sp.]|nr:HU family DNA-binding protein [Thermaerobacter sp.]